MIQLAKGTDRLTKIEMVEARQSSSSNGSSEQAKLLKSTFMGTSLDVWHLYKQSLRAVEVSYLRGREEAFNEVMKYLVMMNRSSDFRYVPIRDFIKFIESRYEVHRDECETRKQALQQAEANRRSMDTTNANLHLRRATAEV